MKKLIVKIKDFFEGGLRRLCGKMSQDSRILTIVGLSVIFAVVNLYVTFRAVYNIGREDARREIKGINTIQIPSVVPNDTLPGNNPTEEFNRLNTDDDGTGE